ncbi:MAG: hypothetical protein AAFX65_00265 [Cyanobacteria bacterium J06638_7]
MELTNPRDIKTLAELDDYVTRAIRAYAKTRRFIVELNPLITRPTRPQDPDLALVGMRRILDAVNLPTPIEIYILINACYTFLNTCRPVDQQATADFRRLSEVLSEYQRIAPKNNRRDKIALTASRTMVGIHHYLYAQSFNELERTVSEGMQWMHSLPDEHLNTYSCWNATTNFIRIIGWSAVLRGLTTESDHCSWHKIQHNLQRVQLIPVRTRLNLKKKAKQIPVIIRENCSASRVAFLILRFINAMTRVSKPTSKHSQAVMILASRSLRPEGSNAKNAILYSNIRELIGHQGFPLLSEESGNQCIDFWDDICGYSSATWRGPD